MGFSFKQWKQDLPAGLVVFLVAVPLCLGIALASGAPLFAGIIAGIVGGLVVAVFSGSALGVSGPAAGLAVIVLTAIADLGDYRVFLLAVVIAGVMQFLLGILRAGIVAYYFPSSVIKGMLAAIGVILILKQIPHALGYDKDPEGDLAFTQPDGHNTFSELFYMFDSISLGAVLVAGVSLAVLILWEMPFMKRIKAFQLIQGPLVAVASGIGLGFLFAAIGGNVAIAPEHMVALPTASSLSEVVGLFTFPDFTAWSRLDVWKVAGTIAIVASIETLLCVEATDKLDPERRVTPTNKELRAQGIGNLVSGLIGGLPVTQVIVRSSANINSGGRTKLSAFLHGGMILAAILIFPGLMNRIPLACLAAILLVVGYKLARISLFQSMWKKGFSQFVPFVVTVVAIVFTDLLLGIGIGMAVAIFFILYNNFNLPFHSTERDVDGRKEVTLLLSEEVSFLNRGRIMMALEAVPDNGKLILDRSRVVSMDLDVQDVINDFMKHAAGEANIEVDIRTRPHVADLGLAEEPKADLRVNE